jgi:peptidoglycan/LPS O-acetylase OafA/YrhL
MQSETKVYFKGLDGVRAIAALSVLFSHVTMSFQYFGLNAHVFGTNEDGSPRTTFLAGFGVTIFFTLSGFLITYFLLRELAEKGKIDIIGFFRRRILRIWPLYFLVFGITILTLEAYGIEYREDLLWHYVFFYSNLSFSQGIEITGLGHYWSLAVEEQFYLTWPLFMLIKKYFLASLIALIVCLILFKVGLRIRDIRELNGEFSPLYSFLNVTRFQCILIGALGAYAYQSDWVVVKQLVRNKLVQLICIAVFLLLLLNLYHVLSVIDNEIISVISILFILTQITVERPILSLERKVLMYLGRISYGIYLWNPIVLFYLCKWFQFEEEATLSSYLFIYLLSFGCTIGLSALAFKFVESPFLRLKYRKRTI